MSKTFCPVPWNFQAIRANGDVRVCCQANITKNQGVIRKDNNIAFNAGRDNLEDSRNAPIIKAIRVNMMNDEWSEECGRCRQEEENGLESRRIYESKRWELTLDQAKNKTNKDGSIDSKDFPVVYYDFRFGNFCNLKCRMCGPTDSSAWYDDWIKLTGSNKFKDTSGIMEIIDDKVAAFNWPEYEPFWEQLENNIPNIEQVYFAGGEPMLIERHYDFLERCVEKGFAKNIIIEYNTNMSTLPGRVLNLWKEFKQVKVGASVDGMGSMLEYQRYPAKWEKTLRNLQTLDGLPNNITSWIAFTVTAYNVNHMIDFMRWRLIESGFKRINLSRNKPIITYHVAHRPDHLNIRVLPDAYKEIITKRFTEFLDWINAGQFDPLVVEHATRIVHSITSYMNSESYYKKEWNNFVKYTKNLDIIRKQSLIETEPLFKEFYAA